MDLDLFGYKDEENKLSRCVSQKTCGGATKQNSNREVNDYYATPPYIVEELLRVEQFRDEILEPCVGGGHIAGVLKEHGHKVKGMDLIDRGYEGTIIQDFFLYDDGWEGDIVTNPPYGMDKDFAQHALEILPDGHKMAMFLKLSFLESKGRRPFFEENPPYRIWVSSSKCTCGMNGDFKSAGGAMAFAWFVWVKGFRGRPEVGWIN